MPLISLFSSLFFSLVFFPYHFAYMRSLCLQVFLLPFFILYFLSKLLIFVESCLLCEVCQKSNRMLYFLVLVHVWYIDLHLSWFYHVQ